MRQDDQRKCTAAKLYRLGLVKQIFRRNAIPKNGITLNPKVEDIFSPQEKQHLCYGLVAIDCSWKRVNEVYI